MQNNMRFYPLMTSSTLFPPLALGLDLIQPTKCLQQIEKIFSKYENTLRYVTIEQFFILYITNNV